MPGAGVEHKLGAGHSQGDNDVASESTTLRAGPERATRGMPTGGAETRRSSCYEVVDGSLLGPSITPEVAIAAGGTELLATTLPNASGNMLDTMTNEPDVSLNQEWAAQYASPKYAKFSAWVYLLNTVGSLVNVNTLMIQDILAEPEWAGVLTVEDLRALTPTLLGARPTLRRSQAQHDQTPRPQRPRHAEPQW